MSDSQPAGASAPSFASKEHTECSAAFHDVPRRSIDDRPAKCENEPTDGTASANKPALTPRQLAAARELIRGASAQVVASMLSTTRQTINRWCRSPEFAAEIRRIHDKLVCSPSALLQPETPSPAGHSEPASPPRTFAALSYVSDDDLDDEDDAPPPTKREVEEYNALMARVEAGMLAAQAKRAQHK